MIVKYKGEGLKVEVTLTAGGNPAALNTYQVIVAILYFKNGQVLKKLIRPGSGLSGAILAQYNEADWHDVNQASGTFYLIVQSKETAAGPGGELYLELMVQKAGETDYENDTLKSIARGIEVCELKDSLLKNSI